MLKVCYIVRHGQTADNAKGILQGHRNTPLSALGKLQAKLVGEALSVAKIDVVYSSDLDRAKETAEEIARHHPCKLILDRRLREAHVGSMQGKTLEECRKLYPRFFDAIKNDQGGTPRPGGGESNNDLYERATSVFEDIRRNHPDSKVVMVTHGGTTRCLLSCALKGRLVQGLPTVGNASISTLCFKKGKWELCGFNDTDHLRSPNEGSRVTVNPSN